MQADLISEKSSKAPINSSGKLATLLAFFALTMNIVSASGFINLNETLDPLRTFCIVGTLICAFGGIAIAANEGYIAAAVISVSIIAAIPLEIYRFSLQTGVPYEPWSGGTFFSLGLFSLFYVVICKGELRKLLTFLFFISMIYALIYASFSIALRMGKISLDSNFIVSADATSGRSARIPLLHGYVVLGLFSATSSFLKGKRRYLSIIIIVLFFTCLYLSQSRTIIAIVSITFFMTVCFQNTKLISIGYFLFFCIGLLASMVVCFNSQLNPLDKFGTGISAWARWSDIKILHSMIGRIWLFGSGISAGDLAFQPLTGVKYFFPSDIGLAGVLLELGVFGVIIYSMVVYAGCYLCSKVNTRLHYPQLVGLLLSGPVLGVYSLLAPVFIGESGMVNGVLFMAIWSVIASKEREMLRLRKQQRKIRRYEQSLT